MRLARYAAFAAAMGISSTAFAQGADDDEEEGWIEEPAAEEEEAAPPPPPPPKKKKAKAKKKKRTKVVIVEETESDDPPAWTLGRRGQPKKQIVAREGEAPPPGYHLEYKSRKNIWIPGVVLLGSGFLASAVTSSFGLLADNGNCFSYDIYYCESREWGWGFVPLVGPFVIAADDDFEPGFRAGYALFGIAQNLGLGLTIGGAASKRGVWVYDGKPRRRGEAGGSEYASTETPMPELTFGPGNVMFKGTF